MGRGYDFAAGFEVMQWLLGGFPWWYWTLLIVGNAPVYVVLMYGVFGSRANFQEACHYFIRPDVWSFFRGEWAEDVIASLKIVFWAGLCVAAACCQHMFIFRHWF